MGAGASVTLPEHAQAHFDKLNDEQKEKWSKYFQDLKAEGYGDEEAIARVKELIQADENVVAVDATADAELVAEAATLDANWFSTAKAGDIFPDILDANEAIEALADTELVKHAAIHEVHRLYKEAKFHHLEIHDHNVLIGNWKVLKYAEEKVPHGINYFMKVRIMENRTIHIRVHRQVHHDIYDFHSLHKTIKGDLETYIWSDDEPLAYFEY